MTNFLPYSLPDISAAELPATSDPARGCSPQIPGSTAGSPTGLLNRMAQTLERRFVTFLREEGARGPGGGDHPLHALAVNSAATGLHLALEALGVGPGDEVITSPYNSAATAGVIRHLGASPVFVDIDPSTLNIDPTRIERAITPRSKVILPIHVGGLACEMGPIEAIAQHHGLRVVEDATHALPSSCDGLLVGTRGTDATIFSLNAARGESGSGGGVIVTPDAGIADRCRSRRRTGADQPSWHSGRTGSLVGEQRVTAPSGPLECRNDLTELAVALGVEQLRRTLEFHQRRGEIAARYDGELRDLPVILPARPAEGDRHASNHYIIRLDHSIRITRDQFIREMGQLGIGCSIHFVPLHLHPYWRDIYQLQPHHFPCAWHAYDRVVCLPLYARMSRDDQSRVIEAVRRVVEIAVARPRHSLIFSTAAAS